MSKTGPKPTTKQCELCDDTFYSKGNFRRHVINVHKFNGNNDEIDKFYKKYIPKQKIIIKKITKPLLDNELEQHDNNDIIIINKAIKEIKEIKDKITDIRSIQNDYEKWKNDVISEHDIKKEGMICILEQMYDKFDSEIHNDSCNIECLDDQINQNSTMFAGLMKQITEQSREINMLKEQLANLQKSINN